MSKKNKQGHTWLTKQFIKRFTALGATDFEYEQKGFKVKFKNTVTQSLWIGFIEGHKMTKKHQFGHFIIGKRVEDDKIGFTEHPHIHPNFGVAMDELDRLHRVAPNVTFGLYQCIKVMQPHRKEETNDS